MPDIDSIKALATEHQALSRLFALHQEALVEHDWARAARLLDHYRERLHGRIVLEERDLLPYCIDKHIPGCWQVYVDEHQALEATLGEAGRLLAAARRRGVSSAALIALLDGEVAAKCVLERHLHQEDVAFLTSLREA